MAEHFNVVPPQRPSSAARHRHAGAHDDAHVARFIAEAFEGSLRTTLRAIGICALRASERAAVGTLVLRARELAAALDAAVERGDDGPSRDAARRTAAALSARLAVLERWIAIRALH